MTSGSVWHSSASERDAWSFIVGRSFIAAVNSGASNSVLTSLWTFADAEDASIEELVGAVPLGSDGGVHSFAVVSMLGVVDESAGDRVISVVVRGSAVVDVFSVGGARRFAAGGMEPWMLADFRSVTAVIVSGDDQPTSPVAQSGAGALPMANGIVRADRLLWSLAPVAFPAETDRRPRAEPVAPDAEPVAPRPHAEVPAPRAEAEDIEEGDIEATIITARDPRHTPSPIDDETVLVSRSGSRSAPAAPPRAATPPIAEFRFRVGAAQPQPLDAPTVIGRNPTAPRVIAGRTPRLVRVESPDAAVSSTHLRLVQEGGAVVATDLRSTNGTLVTPLGGKRRRLRPGEAMVVLVGTRIDIGDGNIIEIMPAEQTLGSAQAPEPGKGPA